MTTKYIAYDGTEFKDKYDCERYEHEFAEACIEKFIALDSIDYDGMGFLEKAGVCFCCDDSLRAITIRDNEVLSVINNYLMTRDNYRGDKLGEDMVGKTVAFWNWDYETECQCLGTREDMLANFEKALDVLFGKEDD